MTGQRVTGLVSCVACELSKLCDRSRFQTFLSLMNSFIEQKGALHDSQYTFWFSFLILLIHLYSCMCIYMHTLGIDDGLLGF